MGQVSSPESRVQVVDSSTGYVIDISSIVSKIDLDMSPGILNSVNVKLNGDFEMHVEDGATVKTDT